MHLMLSVDAVSNLLLDLVTPTAAPNGFDGCAPFEGRYFKLTFFFGCCHYATKEKVNKRP